MLVEYRRDIILRGGLASNPVALGTGVGEATTHTSPQDRQLQFREHGAHLDECLAHGIDLSIAAINRDGADDDQPHVLFFDGADDFA